jgi:ABC-type transport system substrate-binding protein
MNKKQSDPTSFDPGRREALATLGAGLAALPAGAALAKADGGHGANGDGKKVLRVCFLIAETGFDPAQISDIYSRTITPHIFEALYRYDHLARPIKIVPQTADGEPVVSDDFRTFTVKIQRGIFFADDEAFKGQKRELTAADYVYSYKRFADPATKSPGWSTLSSWGILGLNELRKDAIDNKKPFDYDREIEGLRALDRYTLQVKVATPRPRHVETMMAGSDLYGAVAREVVEFYGDKIMAHPVGTGPYRLAQWRRSSFIALERNPTFREMRWEAHPAADDLDGQAIAKKLRGKRLPIVDRVEISIVEEAQPRWLSFRNRQFDYLEVPGEFVPVAMPGGKPAGDLARAGIQMQRVLVPDIVLSYFNMEDPVVGGMEPAKVALRRAICLGVDTEREIRLTRRGLGIPAQSIVVPHNSGYDPKFRSESGEYSVSRAKALLDLFGYTDKNSDGWREQPDGSPLELVYATSPDQTSRQLNEEWRRNMHALGIRIRFAPAKWPENLKSARAGKLMMWGVGSLAASSDGHQNLQRLYGPQGGQQNLARFKHAEFDKVYERIAEIPDGPERLALFDRAKRIGVAFAPYKFHCHRFRVDAQYPWLTGWRRPLFWQEWYHMVDVDMGMRAGADA